MPETIQSVPDTIDRLRGEHGVRASLGIRVGDCRMRIESNSEELIGKLRPYLMQFGTPCDTPDWTITALEAKPPQFDAAFKDWPREGGKVGRKDEFADLPGGRIVRKVRTGMQFLFGRETRLAVGPCLANDNQVINYVNAHVIGCKLGDGALLCHAAGVVDRGRGLAIAGLSGGGKSTLALHLLGRGLQFCSNDRLLIDRADDQVRMTGVPKLPRINPGTALNNDALVSIIPTDRQTQLERLSDDDLWKLEEKYDVDITSLFGPDRIQLEAQLAGLIVLNWSRDSSEPSSLTRVDLRERRDLLGAVIKSPGPFHTTEGKPPERPVPPDPHLYLDLLADVAVHELRGKADFQTALGLSLQALET